MLSYSKYNIINLFCFEIYQCVNVGTRLIDPIPIFIPGIEQYFFLVVLFVIKSSIFCCDKSLENICFRIWVSVMQMPRPSRCLCLW